MASLLRKPFSALTKLGQPPRPGTLAFKAWNRFTGLNNVVYRLSGGRILGSYDGNPVLLLHHVGRRSGEPRVTPLLYLPDGDELVIVASMGGTPKHPAWFHNLKAGPDTEIEVGRERRAVRARVADAGGARAPVAAARRALPRVRRLPGAGRARDPRRDPRSAGVRFSPAGRAAHRMATAPPRP